MARVAVQHERVEVLPAVQQQAHHGARHLNLVCTVAVGQHRGCAAQGALQGGQQPRLQRRRQVAGGGVDKKVLVTRIKGGGVHRYAICTTGKSR